MDYKTLLEHSFEVEKEVGECAPGSRLAYLSESIFNFTTYDSGMDELFAEKAVEVCAAINNGTTFEYINDHESYKWFLLMCNMPFFEDKLEWGASIRGSWWGTRPCRQFELDSCGLWMAGQQLTDTLKFSDDEWRRFIAAVIKFASADAKVNMEVPVERADNKQCGMSNDNAKTKDDGVESDPTTGLSVDVKQRTFSVWTKPPKNESPMHTIGIGNFMEFSASDAIAHDDELMSQAVEICNGQANIILEADDDALLLCVRDGLQCQVTAREVKADLLLHEVAGAHHENK